MRTAAGFEEATQPFRRELLAHCYRMLGSFDEAEDQVQETYLRAWRGWDRFEGRASVRTWLYRIATNACLTALEGRARRALPSGLAGPAADPFAPPGVTDPSIAWLQPVPDAAVAPPDPADVVGDRESLRLALVAALQHLTPQQRAVLLLREVLGFTAPDVAGMLGSTVPAVKSLLQRARARLDEAAPAPGRLEEPDEPRARELLEAYVAAFVEGDVGRLERALRVDARLEVVPSTTWFAGVATCVPYFRSVAGAPGEWRMDPVSANGGQPAVVAYRHGQLAGVVVLTVGTDGIAAVTVFFDPALAARFAG